MQKRNLILSLFLIAGIAFLTGCKKDETPEFTLISLLTDDGIDLAGATQATNAPEEALIIATFSSEVMTTGPWATICMKGNW